MGVSVPSPAGAGLPTRHALLAVAVALVWGTNFVVIREVLDTLPPLTLAVLRYTLAFLPAALLLPRPAVPWRLAAAYGALVGVGQFGLLYLAMRGHISPGLASLVIQTQVFFTIGLAAWLDGERPLRRQWAALALAASGLVLIGAHADGQATSVAGVAMVLLAACSWAAGNLVARRAAPPDMLAFVVWSSAFAVPPLALLAWWADGPAAMARGLAAAGWGSWLAVGWQAWGNTLFGYAAWGWLLARHPAATVVPWALLVPVFGMASSALWLGEPLPAWKLGAAALVLAGLGLNLWRRPP
jgi:O-acetylserine/cysteine efflux transporter